MSNRKHIMQKLDNIQNILDSVMLEEGFNAAVNFVSQKGYSALKILGKWIAGAGSTSINKVETVVNASRTANAVLTAEQGAQMVGAVTELAWYNRFSRALSVASLSVATWFGISGHEANARAADAEAALEAIKNDPKLAEALKANAGALPSNLPAADALGAIANNGTASEKQISIFEKLWNSVVAQYNKFADLVKSGIDTIGGVPFLVLGFGTALGFMMAGVLIYYLNVGGEISASLKRVFGETFNGIKNATGLEQLIRIIMSPVMIVMKFIEESPLGTLFFTFGCSLFILTAILTIIGWDAVFGKKQVAAPAATNKSGANADSKKQDPAATENKPATDTASGSANINTATGTANAGQPKASYLEPIW